MPRSTLEIVLINSYVSNKVCVTAALSTVTKRCNSFSAITCNIDIPRPMQGEYQYPVCMSVRSPRDTNRSLKNNARLDFQCSRVNGLTLRTSNGRGVAVFHSLIGPKQVFHPSNFCFVVPLTSLLVLRKRSRFT